MNESFEVETVPVVGTVAPKKRSSLDVLLVGAAAVALAGLAFAGGRLTAPAAAATTGGAGTTTNTGAAGPGGGRIAPGASFQPGGGPPGGGGIIGGVGGAGTNLALTGSITSASATEVTLQLSNGTTVTIPIDKATTYHSQASATSSDVKAGTKVQVVVSAGGRAQGTASSPAPNASGGPARQLGPASSITIIP